MDAQAQPLATKLSDRKLAANQANARKSTGPRSAKGKQASRLNARKHGLAKHGLAKQPFSSMETRELAASIADGLATHESELARTVATCFDTLNNICEIRSGYIRETDLESASFDDLKELATRISRLDRYERSTSSRLNRAIVDILVMREQIAERTQISEASF